MRIFSKSLWAAPAVLAMAISPAIAAPAGSVPAPVGVIVQADRATVGSDPAASGATVYDGETLHTDVSGLLRVRFGMSQAYLLPRTLVKVQNTEGGFAADMTAGTVVLSSAQGETFHLMADGALIRPVSSQPTVAQITVVSPTELLVMSRKGALEVSMDDEVKNVPDGASYRMVIQPGPLAGPGAAGGGTSQGPVPTGQNHFIFFLVGAAAVGAGLGIYFAVQSPSAPN